MIKISVAVVLLFGFISSSFAQFGNPFKVEARLDGDELKVDVSVPAAHYLYADHFVVTDALGNEQKAIRLAKTAEITDADTGKSKSVFNADFSAVYAWAPAKGGGEAFHIKYWGCNDEVCFMPQNKMMKVPQSTGIAVRPTTETGSNELDK